MPKITVMLDGAILKEVTLTQARTTLGRRPSNDVVIENLAISGNHLVFKKTDHDVTVEDLGSTNGTAINGNPVKQQVLCDGDLLEVGKFKIRFDAQELEDDFEKTMLFKPAAEVPPAAPVPAAAQPVLHGLIKVLSGPAAGRQMVLTKVVTTVGKPGVLVAAITQRRAHFVVHHIEGSERLLLNGVKVGLEPSVLKHGDLIVLAGIEMQFLQS
ncbi:glycogen accumulation regulator GarA [mine drainage metagenome]|uniref:Glycogen accumulation regulator GarA n=1 Tax=mine drainage metagenome TaxID=410659 RepID=A0A1J5PG77_9ZZZZ